METFQVVNEHCYSSECLREFGILIFLQLDVIRDADLGLKEPHRMLPMQSAPIRIDLLVALLAPIFVYP